MLQPCHPSQSWALLTPFAVLSCGEGMQDVLLMCAQSFAEVKCEKQDMDFHVILHNMDKMSRAYE